MNSSIPSINPDIFDITLPKHTSNDAVVSNAGNLILYGFIAFMVVIVIIVIVWLFSKRVEPDDQPVAPIKLTKPSEVHIKQLNDIKTPHVENKQVKFEQKPEVKVIETKPSVPKPDQRTNISGSSGSSSSSSSSSGSSCSSGSSDSSCSSGSGGSNESNTKNNKDEAIEALSVLDEIN